jgi:hypothetical protein
MLKNIPVRYDIRQYKLGRGPEIIPGLLPIPIPDLYLIHTGLEAASNPIPRTDWYESF